MKNSVKGILTVSCGYIAAIIGAGFASGQEIVSFFVRYGRGGVIGITAACAVFTVYSLCILNVCAENGIYSYNGFLEYVFPYKNMCKITEAAVLICAEATLCVMTACAGETLKIVTGAPQIVGSALLAAVCGVIFFLGGRRIMGINSALGAVIIAGIIFSCFYIFRFREHQTFAHGVSSALSGLSYSGYNLISTGAVLAAGSRYIKGKGDSVLSSLSSGITLFIMITLMWGILGIYYGQINLGEIPMLTMALRQNYIFGAFYGIMLTLSVLTTAISNGFAVIDIIGTKMTKKTAAALSLLVALAMSGAGFSALINTLYRACGYGGAIIVLVMIFRVIYISKRKKNEENKRK